MDSILSGITAAIVTLGSLMGIVPASPSQITSNPQDLRLGGQVLQAQTSNCDSYPNNWPQVAHDPQRTGRSSETLGTTVTWSWGHAFQPDKVYPQVQPIVYCGLVIVPTEGANGQTASVWALDAVTGAVKWQYKVGAPILASVAVAYDQIYFGSLDGSFYILDATTTDTNGKLIKKTSLNIHGFSTAPLIVESRVLLGSRDGIFYAFDLDGNLLWQYDIGSPILQTAAYNQGKIFFGAMNMHVYALTVSPVNPADPANIFAWKSERVTGAAFKDYWPVVENGLIFNRPMEAVGIGEYVALDEDTGAKTDLWSPYVDTSWYMSQTMNGAVTPPCIYTEGTSNYFILPWGLGGGSGWIKTQYDNTTHDFLLPKDPSDPDYNFQIIKLLDPDNPTAGKGNGDENHNVSCAGNAVVAFHTLEGGGGAGYSGIFFPDILRWVNISHSDRKNRQMSTSTQGGGGNPPSISNGMIYHISQHELTARKTQ